MCNKREKSKNGSKVQNPRHEEEAHIGTEGGYSVQSSDTPRLEQDDEGLQCNCQEKQGKGELALIKGESTVIDSISKDGNHQEESRKRLKYGATDPIGDCPRIKEPTFTAVFVKEGIPKEIFLRDILIQSIEEDGKGCEECVVGRKSQSIEEGGSTELRIERK